MSRFSERITAALDRIRSEAAESVTYKRGGQSVAVDAVSGATPVESYASFDVVVDATWRDWLIKASELILGGRVVKPAIGDRITQSDGTTWEVLPVEGQRCWRPSDSQGYQIRIHTKQIG